MAASSISRVTMMLSAAFGIPARPIRVPKGPSFITPLPNQAQWDQVIADFVARTPQVGAVVLNTDFITSFAELAETNDCFYLPYNAGPGGELEALLNLDPFMDADPSFDRDDVVTESVGEGQSRKVTIVPR